MSVTRLARELYDRRVPHVLGIYLAAGWGILEFTSWAAERQLPPGPLAPGRSGRRLPGLAERGLGSGTAAAGQ